MFRNLLTADRRRAEGAGAAGRRVIREPSPGPDRSRPRSAVQTAALLITEVHRCVDELPGAGSGGGPPLSAGTLGAPRGVIPPPEFWEDVRQRSTVASPRLIGNGGGVSIAGPRRRRRSSLGDTRQGVRPFRHIALLSAARASL
ncbi:hypothetical protein GN956_G18636 [Arapaima gigas]